MRPACHPLWRSVPVACVAAALALACSPVTAAGQSLTLARAGEALHVQAPGLRVLDGEALKSLKDGRSLRLDLELVVLAAPGGRTIARVQQAFTVSYDLWEEQVAVARIGTPPRSISHLSPREAEAWCLEHLVVPADALSPAETFWLRLTYRVVDPERRQAPPEDAGLTIWTLVDVLSRRNRDSGNLEGTIQGGPFRLADVSH